MARRSGDEPDAPTGTGAVAGPRRPMGDPDDRGVYIISVAAELAGVHPQTLRIYERKGLLRPSRTAGNTRRYSRRDIAQLQMIQKLTQEFGVNLAGVKMIVEMEDELDRMRRRIEKMDADMERSRRRLREEVERLRSQTQRGEIVPRSSLQQLRLRLREAERQAADTRRGPIPVGPGTDDDEPTRQQT
jgi:MerR family transcriptional regulator/heat shock protein HspR